MTEIDENNRRYIKKNRPSDLKLAPNFVLSMLDTSIIKDLDQNLDIFQSKVAHTIYANAKIAIQEVLFNENLYLIFKKDDKFCGFVRIYKTGNIIRFSDKYSEHHILFDAEFFSTILDCGYCIELYSLDFLERKRWSRLILDENFGNKYNLYCNSIKIDPIRLVPDYFNKNLTVILSV